MLSIVLFSFFLLNLASSTYYEWKPCLIKLISFRKQVCLALFKIIIIF
jgi:hypothetical protein